MTELLHALSAFFRAHSSEVQGAAATFQALSAIAVFVVTCILVWITSRYARSARDQVSETIRQRQVMSDELAELVKQREIATRQVQEMITQRESVSTPVVVPEDTRRGMPWTGPLTMLQAGIPLARQENSERFLKICNLGSGPALNVKLQNVRGGQAYPRFTQTDGGAFAPSGSGSPMLRNWAAGQDFDFEVDDVLHIEYSSIDGRHFETVATYKGDRWEDMSTRRIETRESDLMVAQEAADSPL